MAALDARFLIDVHFRQGGKDKKDSFPLSSQADAQETRETPPGVIPTEQWHSDEEQIGSYEHSSKKDNP